MSLVLPFENDHLVLWMYHPYYLLVHFLFSINCSAPFSLFNLPVSDIIDRDKEKYQRRYVHPMASGPNGLWDIVF